MDSLIMVRTLPFPQNLIIGIFLFLAAAAFAAAPLALVYRSLGILFAVYLIFIAGGTPFAFLTALITPLVGLIGGDQDWLIMLPILLSSNLLAVLGLEYAWRYPALIISPLLSIAPQVIAQQLSRSGIFEVTLPWEPASTWLGLHALTALAGTLVTIYLDRRMEQREPKQSLSS
jgi:hypothetical protein